VVFELITQIVRTLGSNNVDSLNVALCNS